MHKFWLTVAALCVLAPVLGSGAARGAEAPSVTPEVDHEQALGRIAKLGGISDDKFQSCIKDEKMADAIAASRVVAEKEYGVESTPTFFINGSKMVGEQSYEAFEKALTAAQPKT